MLILMRRIVSDDDTTLGIFETETLRGATCEDEARAVKVAGETRIPAGSYEVQLRTESPMADRYRERFGEEHRGIPWLQDVPGFTYVYLHVGNDDDDTDGCILVADKANFFTMTVEQSTVAYQRLQHDIQDALESGEQVFITITDDDQPPAH